MNRHEPEVRNTGFEHGVDVRRCREPLKKTPHLLLEPVGVGRLEMHLFFAERPGDDLHRSGLAAAPRPDGDAVHPGHGL